MRTLAAVILGIRRKSTIFRAALAAVALAGPAGARPEADLPDWTPVATRIDAIIGAPIVLPIAESDGHGGWLLEQRADWVPRGDDDATLVTKETCATRLVLFEGLARDDDSGWLPAPLRWRATPREEVAGRPARGVAWFWAAVIEAPSRPVGRSLRLAGRPVRIRWHQAPAPGEASGLVSAPDAERDALRALGEALRPELEDPLRRWRARLVAERIGPMRLWGDPGVVGSLADDPDLEALALQQERRARLALRTLQRLEPTLAARVAALMTGVVSLPTGRLAPVWLVDDTADQALFAALLDDERSEADRRVDAEAWLDARPWTVSWVIDESGLDEAGRHLATVGVTNLISERQLTSAAVAGEAVRNARMLPALESGVWRLTAPTSSSVAAVVRSGPRTRSLGLLTEPLFATPPGLGLGPLFPRWSMAAWVTGAPPRPERGRATIALLQRAAPDGAGEPGWELFVEAWMTPDLAPEDERLEVHLGPHGGSRAVITASPAAGARIRWDDGLEQPWPVRTGRDTDRWTALVPLPADAIERGRLRLGLARSASGDRLWSWPRPLLPGQTTPARLWIDLTGWSPAP